MADLWAKKARVGRNLSTGEMASKKTQKKKTPTPPQNKNKNKKAPTKQTNH